ncbi:MAG: hypothetical protein AAGG68_04075 [Bacteroidota bacterium]
MNTKIACLLFVLFLCCVHFSTAQSLYQDALSLSEILKNEAQDSSGQLTSNPPALVAERERKGIRYFLAKNPISYLGGAFSLAESKIYLVIGASSNARISLGKGKGKEQTDLYSFKEPSLRFVVHKNVDEVYVSYRDLLYPENDIQQAQVKGVRVDADLSFSDAVVGSVQLYESGSYSSIKEIQKNQLVLSDIGNYFLTGFTISDTIQLSIEADQKSRIYFKDEETLMLEQNGSYQELPYHGILKIVHQLEEIRIAGSYFPKDEITLEFNFSSNRKANFSNRKIRLRPKDWHEVELPLYAENDGQQYLVPFVGNKRVLDERKYTLKGSMWKDYIAHVVQGSEVLFEEVNTFVDSLTIQYTPKKGEVDFQYTSMDDGKQYASERYYTNGTRNVHYGAILEDKFLRKYHAKTDNPIFHEINAAKLKSKYKEALEKMSFQVHGFLQIDPKEAADVRSLNIKELAQRPEFNALEPDRYEFSREDVVVPGASYLFSKDYFEQPAITFAKGEAFAFLVTPPNQDSETAKKRVYNSITVFVLTDPKGHLKLLFARPEYKYGEEIYQTYLGIRTFDDFALFQYVKPLKQYQVIKKTKDVQNIPAILGTHNNFQSNRLKTRNLLGEIVSDYKQNPILRRTLNDYLQHNQFGTTQEDFVLQNQIAKNYQTHYSWQRVLYDNQKLELEQKVSYQDLASNYRRTIPTASDNLQQASQELASGQKKLTGGLNAATIAAGLSDFVVERAQEELNINFLDRMRDHILNDTSEFKVLFPNTHEMFDDFQIVHYRTLLEFAKTAFVTDLQDLGLNFPRLFDLQKYQKLKDDPNVYNIFLIYDLANKIYEDTPVDSVLLHLYDRLNSRENDLDANLNRNLSTQLLEDSQERNRLIIECEMLFESLNRFDYGLLMRIDSIFLNSTYSNKDEVRALSQRLDERIQTQYGKSISAANKYKYFFKPEEPRLLYEDWKETPISNEQSRSWLFSEDQLNSNVQLKKYEYLIPNFLDGDPFYEYTLSTLPYQEFDDYFNHPPADSILVESGLNLLKEFLEGRQLKVRQRWLDIFIQEVETMAEREEQIAIENTKRNKNFPQSIASLFMLKEHQQDILDILDQRINQLNPSDRVQKHDIQALRYLKQQMDTEAVKNQLINWAYIQDHATRFDETYYEAYRAEQEEGVPFPYDINNEYFKNSWISLEDFQEANSTAQNLIQKMIALLEKLDEKYSDQNTEIELYESVFHQKDTLAGSLNVRQNYYENIYSPNSKINQLYKQERQKKRFNDRTYLQDLLFVINQNVQHVERENEFYFRRLSKEVVRTQEQLEVLKGEFDALTQHLTKLEAKFAPEIYKTRQHAQDFSTLTETALHLFNAFRSGSTEVDSIIRLDTLVQTVRLLREGQEITYDSISIVPRNIATGRDVRKWITKSEFEYLMNDPLTRNTFLGLLYQRLKTINPNINFTSEGIALTSTKLINTIYELDELRANVRYQKLQGKQLNFEDYYPFIRTAVDLLNIILTTPIGEQTLEQHFPTLQGVPKISDQSLSLFENIFAENYSEVIRNVVNLLTIIWAVDLEKAQAEMKAIQDSSLQSLGLDTRSIEKQNKKKIANNERLKKAMVVYGTFMANIVAAQTADQVKGAIKAVAVPPGSSSVKRSAKFNVALNSYFGGGFYQETLTNSLIQQNAQSGSVGLAVPVGITASVGGLGKSGNWSYSLFVPILDIGAVTAYRIDQQNVGANGNLPELTFGNLIAPGGYLILNFPKSPFSISAGAQFGPQTRKITINGADLTSSAWRYGLTATIDVPIFNLFNR